MIAATSEGNITSVAREILENDPAFCSGYRPGGVGSGPDFSTGSPDGFTFDFRVEGDELYTEIVKPLKQAPYLATWGPAPLGARRLSRVQSRDLDADEGRALRWHTP
jgi:hypothetical protein